MLTLFDTNLTLLLHNLFPHIWLLDQLFLFASWVGTYGAVWIVGAILMVLFEMIHHHARFIRHFALSMVVCWLLVVGVKNAVKRPRPFNNPVVARQLQVAYLQKESGLPTDFSFPSGHAALAFCGATIISLHLMVNSKRKTVNKNKPIRTSPIRGGQGGVIILCYLGAVIIAFSRIYLGVHYAGDVVVGGVMGILVARIFN